MKKQDQTSHYDVIVVGAGPSGLAFVQAISGQGLSIAVVEPSTDAGLANPDYDGREIALTHASYDVLNDMGILSHIGDDKISRIKKAHVINGDEPYALRFDHREAGADTLGYMVSNQNIRRATYVAVKDLSDVTWFLERKAKTISSDDISAYVQLDDGHELSATLLVGSDGRFSNTRRMMAVKTDVVDWGRTCLVGVMDIDGTHNDTAYECFHYDRTLAVLPLNNNQVSVVITLPTSESASVMGMSNDDFSRDIERRFESRVGKMSVHSKVQSYPLACTYAQRFYARRFALIGDAAVGMHPVTAHGYNLGLRGATVLADQVKAMFASGGDIGSHVVLSAYNRDHQIRCKPLYHGTNTLVKLFSDTRPPVKIMRKALLRLGNVLKPANKLIMRQLTDKSA